MERAVDRPFTISPFSTPDDVVVVVDAASPASVFTKLA
jgi:hypothetical protein